MGAAISQSVKSKLQTQTLAELLSDDKYVKDLQELSPGLPDKIRRNLIVLLQETHANSPTRRLRKRRTDSPADNPAKRPSKAVQSAITRESTQKNVPKAVAPGTSITGSSATTALSMMPSTAPETAKSDATPGEDNQIGRVWRITKEEVSLSPEIAESFGMWKANPSTFLRKESLQTPSTAQEYYDYTLSLGDSIAADKIRWRFMATTYYDVISKRSLSSSNAITKEAVAFVVAVVCPSSSLGDQKKAEYNVSTWAKAGAKYRALADAIGGTWCYFLLPSIGESNWTKLLKRDEVKAAGKLLVNLGIRDEAQRLDAMKLAEIIATELMEPFESVTPLQPHGQMILSTSLQKVTNGTRAVGARAVAYKNTAGSQIYNTSIPSRQRSVRMDSCTTSPFGHCMNSPETLVPEMLHDIAVYFENMLPGHLEAVSIAKGARLCSDFDSYCFTATMLTAHGLGQKFHYSIAQATILLDQILLAEHPRTLACFFEVFIHFIRTGLPDVIAYFCRQIKVHSAQHFPVEHPWRRICCFLGELDPENLEETLANAWKYTVDIFDRQIGPLEPLAVSSRLDYLKRVFGTKNDPHEERLLRELLARFEKDLTMSTPRVMLNLAHNLRRQQRYDEAKALASEVTELLERHGMYAQKVAEKIECLKIISHIQYEQGSRLAEQTMRRAILMVESSWGKQHPWVFEFNKVLHGWLQSWDREPDAKALWGEIENFVEENKMNW